MKFHSKLVKGIELPPLSPIEILQLNLYAEEDPDERIDHVEHYGERLIVTTSEFIDLNPRVNVPRPHLQIIRRVELWDEGDGTLEGFDPYGDADGPYTYREVMVNYPYSTYANWVAYGAPTDTDLHLDYRSPE